MADLPPGRGPKGKGKKGLKGRFGGKKGLLVFGGAAAAVAAFALIKKGSGSGSGTAATGTTAAGTPTYDSTATDQYNQLADQLAALQGQLATLTAGSSSKTPTGPTTPPPVITPPGSPKPPVVLNPKPGVPKPKQSVGPIKASGPRLSTVTVSRNQTLSGIAQSHGESLGTLLKDNPVYKTNPKYKGGNRIWAGDKVKVR